MVLGFFLILSLNVSGWAVEPESETDPETLVREIYELVSAAAGESVDWDRLSSRFHEEAVVVLRTSREATTRFTREGFIEDFKSFYKTPAVVENGFGEKVLQVNSNVYKDMAYVAVVYEASIPNTGRPPQQGIDLWLVSRADGMWKVLAVTNEVILPGEEIPDFF